MIQFQVNEDELKRQITQAVLGSIVGELLTKQVQEALSVNAYDSPVKRAVTRAVESAIQRLLDTEYKLQVETAVRSAINEDVLKNVVELATAKTMSMLKDR